MRHNPFSYTKEVAVNKKESRSIQIDIRQRKAVAPTTHNKKKSIDYRRNWETSFGSDWKKWFLPTAVNSHIDGVEWDLHPMRK